MLKHTIQFITIAIGILFLSVQGAFAQYPAYQQALLNERVGFGANTTGGAGGAEYWVTNLADSGPGSLRDAVSGDTHRWILFAVSGDIYASSPIDVGWNKTIDARTKTVRLFSNGLVIRSRNVILENLIIKQGTDDGVKILDGGGDVWIDHCSFNQWSDEALSIIQPLAGVYTDVTVSWCKFTYINHMMLIGHTNGDVNGSNMRVTLHHNWLGSNYSRQPRIRRGWVHAYNNYLVNWGEYGMASLDAGQVRTENNIFEAGSAKSAVITSYAGEPRGYTNLGYDWKINGAVSSEYMPNLVFWPPNYYGYSLDAANSTLRSTIITNAGATR